MIVTDNLNTPLFQPAIANAVSGVIPVGIWAVRVKQQTTAAQSFTLGTPTESINNNLTFIALDPASVSLKVNDITVTPGTMGANVWINPIWYPIAAPSKHKAIQQIMNNVAGVVAGGSPTVNWVAEQGKRYLIYWTGTIFQPPVAVNPVGLSTVIDGVVNTQIIPFVSSKANVRYSVIGVTPTAGMTAGTHTFRLVPRGTGLSNVLDFFTVIVIEQ